MKIFNRRYKRSLKTILVAVSALLISSNSYGQSPYSAIADGNWSNDDTWSGKFFEN